MRRKNRNLVTLAENHRLRKELENMGLIDGVLHVSTGFNSGRFESQEAVDVRALSRKLDAILDHLGLEYTTVAAHSDLVPKKAQGEKGEIP